MEKTNEKLLIDALKMPNVSFNALCVPISCDKRTLANSVIKRIIKGFSNIYYVSWAKEDSSQDLSYDKLLDYSSKDINTLFILDCMENYNVYSEELSSIKNNKNYYLLLDDINLKKEDVDVLVKSIMSNKVKPGLRFWAQFADMEIIIDSNNKKIFIGPEQSEKYLKLYNSTQKESVISSFGKDFINNDRDLKEALNVSSFSSLKTEKLSTYLEMYAPKFRTIITDLLLDNKCRHVLYMIDGKNGINLFDVCYRKVRERNENIIPMIILRNSDSNNEKREKLNEFNYSNLPMVLLTDCVFENKDKLMNVDNVKFTNGGNIKHFSAIVEMLKAYNYTGAYSRKFTITKYCSVISGGLKTIDEINAKNFDSYYMNKLNNHLECKNSEKVLKLYLKDEDFYIRSG